MATVRLVSKEGTRIDLSKELAVKCGLFKTMLEDAPDDEELPVPSVTEDIMRIVIEYLQHVSEPNYSKPNIERPVKSNNFNELVPAWEAQFTDKPYPILWEMVSAGVFLDMKDFYELAAAKLASVIKGKTAEEIRQLFGIVNDLTPEEIAKIQEENKWADEL